MESQYEVIWEEVKKICVNNSSSIFNCLTLQIRFLKKIALLLYKTMSGMKINIRWEEHIYNTTSTFSHD